MDFSTIGVKNFYELKEEIRNEYIIDCVKRTGINVFFEGSKLVIKDKYDIEFIFVPGGYFNQGLSDDEYEYIKEFCQNGRIDVNELRPVHRVYVNNLLVSKTPVTYSQLNNIGFAYSNKNIVAYESKERIDSICSKLGYRILKEKEWEYIARAGNYSLFTFGNEIPDDNEMDKWLNMDFSDLTKCKANSLGFIGLLSGEWCSDHYKYPNESEARENEFCIKGGGAYFWPWQDEEWIWCLSAMKMSSSGLIDNSCGFHFVIDIER